MFPAEMVRYEVEVTHASKPACVEAGSDVSVVEAPDLDDCEPSLPEHPWREGFFRFQGAR